MSSDLEPETPLEPFDDGDVDEGDEGAEAGNGMVAECRCVSTWLYPSRAADVSKKRKRGYGCGGSKAKYCTMKPEARLSQYPGVQCHLLFI